MDTGCRGTRPRGCRDISSACGRPPAPLPCPHSLRDRGVPAAPLVRDRGAAASTADQHLASALGSCNGAQRFRTASASCDPPPGTQPLEAPFLSRIAPSIRLALFFQALHGSAETPPVTREVRLSSTMSIRLGIESKAARLGCCIELYRQPTRRRHSSLQGNGRCLPASRSQGIVMGGRGARWHAPIERSDGVACSRPDPTYLSR